VLAVDEGSLQGEVDEPCCDTVLPNGDLAQNEGLGAGRLHGQDVANAGRERVDLVQEKKVRDAAILELFQDQLECRHALRIRLADDNRCIAGGQRGRALVLKFNRPRAVDEGELVPQILDIGDVQLDAHAVGACFWACVSNGRALCNASLSGNRAAACEDRFKERGLAAEVGSDECDAPGGAAILTSGLPHGFPPQLCSQASGRAPRAPRLGRSAAGSSCSRCLFPSAREDSTCASRKLRTRVPGEYSADASTGVERLAAGRGRALRNNRAFPLRLIRQSCLAAAGNGF